MLWLFIGFIIAEQALDYLDTHEFLSTDMTKPLAIHFFIFNTFLFITFAGTIVLDFKGLTS